MSIEVNQLNILSPSPDSIKLQPESTNNLSISNKLTDLEAEFNEYNNPEDPNAFIPVGFTSSNDSIVVQGTTVGIKVVSENIAELLPQLEELGFEMVGEAFEFNFVEGYIPIDAISSLESMNANDTVGISPLYQTITYAGSVTSQADSGLNADDVRSASPVSFDGTGVTIGVLSDSYDNFGILEALAPTGRITAADDIASGDLPKNVTVIQDFPVTISNNILSGRKDEGRAMLQLIHDLAPGANLMFATASLGQTSFASNIKALAQAEIGRAHV